MKKKLNYSPSPAKRTSKQIHQNTHWSFERSVRHESPSKQFGNKNHTQLQSVIELSENFKKKILMNIQLLDSIQQRSMPQRCQQHNNIFSLYCETQRKPLCASCVYQNETHRKHTIIPVNQSGQFLKQDIIKNREKLDKFIGQLSKTIKQKQRLIEQIQQQYPHYILKLEKHYTHLHETLVRKEKEQINQIRYFKDKVRYENAAIATELNQIACFMVEKLQRSAKVTDQNMLSQYRILSCLNSAESFLKKNMEPMILGQSIVNSKIFTAAAQYLAKNLQLSFPSQVAHDQYLKQTYNSNHQDSQKKNEDSQKYLKNSISAVNANKQIKRQNLSTEKIKSIKINNSQNISNKIDTKFKVTNPSKNIQKSEDPYHMTFSPNKNTSFSQIKNKSSKNIKKETKTPPKQKVIDKKLSNRVSPPRQKSKTPEIGKNVLSPNKSAQKNKKTPLKNKSDSNLKFQKPKVTCAYHHKNDKSHTPNKKKIQ